MSFNSTSFRDALGRFPTGVTVVTACTPEGRKIGITVNSFTSLSLEPPLILFCLDRSNPDLEDLQAAERFAVNFLGQDQGALSNTFAMETGDKWRDIEAEATVRGCPLLNGTLAVLECRLADCFSGGDHLILTGRVEAINLGSEDEPLVYYRGAYRRLTED